MRPGASAGPSTSPLDGMNTVCTLSLAAITLVWHGVALAQPAVSSDPTTLLAPQNSKDTFVTSDFARKLGALILDQAGVRFDPERTTTLDKEDVWWVTFSIKAWPKQMEEKTPGLPDHLTFRMRKRDGAILSAQF